MIERYDWIDIDSKKCEKYRIKMNNLCIENK